jgi:hypothetical protein
MNYSSKKLLSPLPSPPKKDSTNNAVKVQRGSKIFWLRFKRAS